MPIAPIQILTRPQQDGVGAILSQGTRVLTDALSDAITLGRQAADLQQNQENAFLKERDRIDLLNERKGNELRRRYETDRTFGESILRDRRDFSEGQRRFGATLGLQQQRLGMEGQRLALSERKQSFLEDRFRTIDLPIFEENMESIGIQQDISRQSRDALPDFIRDVESLASRASASPEVSLDQSMGILGGGNIFDIITAPPTPRQSASTRAEVIAEMRAMDPKALQSNLQSFNPETRALAAEALELGPTAIGGEGVLPPKRMDIGPEIVLPSASSFNTTGE